MNAAKYTVKLIYTIALVGGTLAGVITAVFGALDVTGITEGQVEQLLEMPENLNELIDKAILALDKYLSE